MKSGRPPRQHTLLPRGLSRVEAAEYIGISATKFDELVRDGRMPGPKAIDSRRVWDRHQIDRHFEELPDVEEKNPWDKISEKKAPTPDTERKLPIIPETDAHYKWLGFDPATMTGDDYTRLFKEAQERWKASIPGAPLNVRERRALNQLAAYGVGARAKDSAIKDCGPGTLDRLMARGFVETQNQEKYPDRLEYLILTAAGMKAWEELG